MDSLFTAKNYPDTKVNVAELYNTYNYQTKPEMLSIIPVFEKRNYPDTKINIVPVFAQMNPGPTKIDIVPVFA